MNIREQILRLIDVRIKEYEDLGDDVLGEGGYYSVTYDYYNGGYEEDDSLCKKCYQKKFDCEHCGKDWFNP